MHSLNVSLLTLPCVISHLSQLVFYYLYLCLFLSELNQQRRAVTGPVVGLLVVQQDYIMTTDRMFQPRIKLTCLVVGSDEGRDLFTIPDLVFFNILMSFSGNNRRILMKNIIHIEAAGI